MKARINWATYRGRGRVRARGRGRIRARPVNARITWSAQYCHTSSRAVHSPNA